MFSQYGDIVHVKIPVGKRCGFVQFSDRYHCNLCSVNLKLHGLILNSLAACKYLS